MDKDWLELFFSYQELNPNRTGHSTCPSGPPYFGGRINYDKQQDVEQRNLGLGWLYYALVRMYKMTRVVCIGSGRGFVPLVLAKGIKDNGGGALHFIDPSLDDDFWKDTDSVVTWFETFGVRDIVSHYLVTTQVFVTTEAYSKLEDIELLFIDGSHFYENVKFDFEVFKEKIANSGLIAFHDTISRSLNPRWQGARKVVTDIANLEGYQLFDFKLGAGFTLVQKITFPQTSHYVDWSAEQWKDKDSEEF